LNPLDGQHRWRPGLTLDGTQLSLDGYDRLVRAIKPAILEGLGKGDQHP
jgi:hypothetical protein